MQNTGQSCEAKAEDTKRRRNSHPILPLQTGGDDEAILFLRSTDAVSVEAAPWWPRRRRRPRRPLGLRPLLAWKEEGKNVCLFAHRKGGRRRRRRRRRRPLSANMETDGLSPPFFRSKAKEERRSREWPSFFLFFLLVVQGWLHTNKESRLLCPLVVPF